MTFQEYTPFGGPRSGQVYPPVASLGTLPKAFQRSYGGSPELMRRVRKALRAYAVRTWKFWQSAVFILVIGTVVVAAVARMNPGVYVLGFAFVVAFAATIPIAGFYDAAKVAKLYSDPRVTYASSFGPESFVWRTGTGIYEVRWDSVARSVHRDGVTVLGLRGTRAICVVPDELVTESARQHLPVE